MFIKNNFVRAASASPVTVPGDVEANTAELVKIAEKASGEGADVLVFPELSVTSYTCGDLFRQKTLLERSSAAIESFTAETADLDTVFILGAPLKKDGRLFNCAVAVFRGAILGVIPKTYIPNNSEYYEARWFSSAFDSSDSEISVGGSTVPFKPELIFRSNDKREFTFSVEICEDLWAVKPPSLDHSLMGAEIIFNLSASNELAGKADYRRDLVITQSARCLGAYVYSSSGTGESTTDTVFGGHLLIAENGKLLSSGRRFERDSGLIFADIDLDIIRHERLNSFSYSRGAGSMRRDNYSLISFGLQNNEKKSSMNLSRNITPRPFVPSSHDDRNERCEEIFNIQSTGLATRMEHTGISRTVIGLSGGLDSTLALLVTMETCRKLGINRSEIYPVTMPGFGTTSRTKGNVDLLCEKLGIDIETISIVDSTKLHLKDIGHNGTTTDITYENAQARERTQILMDKANQLGALVIGTGDLSELALGWATYNGDHMSMYAVNSGVPKTLVSFLIEYYMEERADDGVAEVLRDILKTPISPELLPPDKEGNIAQKTEDTVGPYELHDFFLYYIVRYGMNPGKVHFLAEHAFNGRYTGDEILKWLKVFYGRFFSQQFKRSAIPDGPKVGTIALSPRADWRMPSDASASVWLSELDRMF